MRLTGRTKLRSVDRHLKGIEAGRPVVVALLELERHQAELEWAGFQFPLEVGQTVLPAPRGSTSHFNALGGEIIHRDQPKETVYRQQEWTWEEWRGPYDRVERSRIVDVPYERYPRTEIPAPSVELTIATDVSGAEAVIIPALEYAPQNAEALLHRINLFRDLFGECDLLTEDLAPFMDIRIRRVNWEILPPGEAPWPQIREAVAPLLRDLGERVGPAAEARLQLLTDDFEPAFRATGRAGFYGYFVFGYPDTELTVLESLLYGNATYVFGEEWEDLSQLTKAEILTEDLHRARVVHREGWANEMRGLLGS